MYKSVTVKEQKDCNVTRDELIEIYDSLLCVQKKKTNKGVNKYLGNILSLINTQDYCYLDIQEIKDFINGFDCKNS
jgi:hypothetical protein